MSPVPVGSLYEETIQNGFAKLLSVTNIDNVAAVGISMPAGYDSYLFDLDALYMSVHGGALIGRVSNNNGASWLADSYWWSATTVWGAQPAGTFSHYSSIVMMGGHETWLWLTHGFWGGMAGMGRIRCYPSLTGNVGYVLWKTGILAASADLYSSCHIGSGFCASQSAMNAMWFGAHVGVITSGVIRLFGIKNGA